MKVRPGKAAQMAVKLRSWRARWHSGRIALLDFGRAAVGILLLLFWMSAAAAQQGPVIIQGTVRDRAGAPVSDASVRLEQDGNSRQQAMTKANGSFTFAGLASGVYVVSAEKSGQRSAAITVNPDAPEGKEQLALTLDLAGSTKDAPPMEFADTPNFTIAAVTDWTAAGGHGSDAVLRTSEALNRETVALKPSSSGTASVSGEAAESESALKAAVVRNPADVEANRKLGEFYLRANRFQDAIPPLRAASKLDPNRSQTEYDLALALEGSGDRAGAGEQVAKLQARNDNADAHRLAGELDEKLGDPLAAVHELERAVREDPSERNYFEWGSELLLHRAVWQAKDVFSAGVKAYPKSVRMLTALGAALFAGALYDEAAQRLCQASDLNPADPEPYLFMGKIEISAPNPLACVDQKLARFVELRPDDPLANYYYAMTVWKQKGQSIDPATSQRVEELLIKAVTLDPQCGEAYLQLGVLESTRQDYAKAIGYYTKAIQANPQMSNAHYRLGVAYDRVGDKESAKKEFQLHDEIEKQQAALVDKQRREVKQFLVVVNGKTTDSSPQ
jgi:tetratricopeptide (TPR) repeat protein